MISNALAKYVLDTNVLISAFRRYYKPELCPGFWRALAYYHGCGQILSIDEVLRELAPFDDALIAWARDMPPTFFASSEAVAVSDEFDKMMKIVRGKKQYTEQATTAFSNKADSSLIAYAKATGAIVVTEEVGDIKSKGRVKIPTTCDDVGVPCIDPFTMLCNLKIELDWKEPESSSMQ